MNRVFPFISVDNAEEAIELYIKAFDGKIKGEITRYGEFEPDKPYKDKIAHATIQIEQSHLFISDALDQPYVDDTRFTVNVELPSLETVKSSYDVMVVGAKKIYNAPIKLPWSELGYTLRDKYGVIWMVYYRK